VFILTLGNEQAQPRSIQKDTSSNKKKVIKNNNIEKKEKYLKKKDLKKDSKPTPRQNSPEKMASKRSRRATPRDLLNQALKEQSPKIEYLFDEKFFSEIEEDDEWENIGEKNRQKSREEWRENITEDQKPQRTSYQHDIDAIATCIAKYKTFETPVPIDLLAEILEITWTEAPTI
jgi:hypothetical protein